MFLSLVKLINVIFLENITEINKKQNIHFSYSYENTV